MYNTYDSNRIEDLDYRFGKIVEAICCLEEGQEDNEDEPKNEAVDVAGESKALLEAIESFLRLRFKGNEIKLTLTIKGQA